MSIDPIQMDDKLAHSIDHAVESGQMTAEAGQNLSRWLTQPYYASYRQSIVDLIQESDFATLNQLFWERIPFGTGGRRGPISEFGSATINARTIAESAQGLAVYVKQVAHAAGSVKDQTTPLRAVIARDTRHRSTEFARLTASILAANEFKVFFFPEPRATPELSFAVRHLQCDTGVMISASHNPPSDNGFKAYWNTGGQVLPPHDAGIISCVDACQEIPQLDFDQAVSEGRIVLLTDESEIPSVDQAYIDSVCQLSLSPARTVKALFTPLHGVGESSIYRAIQQLGFSNVDLYEPQRSQDGSFPNVPDHLPNPERPKALRPAIEFAKRHGHDLVLASDPDADRLAVACRTANDEFVCLSGNQLGALIADYVLSKRASAGTLSAHHFLVETLVTTPMIEAIGHSYGVRVIRDLLVGFKHIAAAVDANGPDKFVFAAEESVGYLAGEYCRDKDACVGAVFALELASELQQRGQIMIEHLDELYLKHGYYHELQFVQVCPGPEGSDEIRHMMKALREKAPATLGSIVFETVHDYQQHIVRSLPSNTIQSPLPQPAGDLLIFSGNSGNCRVSFAGRPSGTEPKIKFYLFANSSPGQPLSTAKADAKRCLTELEAGLKEWLVAALK